MKKAIQFNCLILTTLLAPLAWAETGEDKATPPKPEVHKFNVSVGGEVVATSEFRVSHPPKKGRFASWKEVAKKEGFVPVWAFQQLRPDGALLKYQRLEDRRLGPGIIAFSKGNMVRIVGKNQKRAPVEIETAYHALWDPKSVMTMWDWPRRLGSAGDSVRLAFYNAETGKPGAVEGTRAQATVFKVEDRSPMAVTKWTLTGLGVRPVTLYATSEGLLVYVSDGERSILLTSFMLSLPKPPDEPASEEGGPTEKTPETPKQETEGSEG